MTVRMEVHVAARMEELPAVGVAGPVVHLPHELELVLARRVDVCALKIPIMLLGRSIWQLSGRVPVPLAAVEVGWVGGERLALAPGNLKPAGMARPVPRRRVRKGIVVRREADVEPTWARHKVVPLRHRGRPRTHRDVCANAQTREHDLQLGQNRHGGKARGDHHVRKLAEAVGKPVEEDGHDGQFGLLHIGGAPFRCAYAVDEVQRGAVLGVAKGRAVAVGVERKLVGIVHEEGHLQLQGLGRHKGALRAHGELRARRHSCVAATTTVRNAAMCPKEATKVAAVSTFGSWGT
eukprot:scaffold98762_cov69-Phaeocystis_antarctica.AAC.3